MINLSDFKRLIAPLQRKIYLFAGRAILTAINNSESTQKIQIIGLSGETITDIERFQEYGLETYPKANAEALTLFLNGNRDHGITICVHDRRYRPDDLSEGEAALYTHEDQNTHNHRIHLKAGQIIDALGLIINIIGATKINEETTDKEETISNDKIETIGGNKTETITGNTTQTAVNITKTASGLLTLGGLTLIITGSGVTINTSGITHATGDIKATAGDVEDQKGTMEEMRTTYNSHTHNETGAVTNAPNQPMI